LRRLIAIRRACKNLFEMIGALGRMLKDNIHLAPG
jgi:hypothetical protein